MTGGPAHRHAEVPAAGRFRVLHEALHDADAGMAGGFVAERRERQRQPQIVVDALGHLHDLHDAAALDGDGAAHHVVAADADERVDLELGERRDRVLQALGVARDVAARGAEEHAAIEVDARDLLDRQLVLFVGVALGEPVEAVVEADRHASDLDGFDGDRADDAVGAGRGTAADDDADAFDGHGCSVAGSFLRLHRREVLEALAERARRQMGRVGEPVHPGGVREVLGFEPDHVGAGDSEPFAVDVHEADLRLAGLRLPEVVEGNRHEAPALDADHGAAAAAEQEPHGAVAEVAAVLGVEGNGVRASQLVADVLVA